MKNQSHYFSTPDAAQGRRREITVDLHGAPRNLVTSTHVFSPEGIDRGTLALLKTVPEPAATGTFLDIGTGWGPLGLTMALASPDAEVYGVEVNERALGLAQENAQRLGLKNFHARLPDEVDESLGFDLIWSNPPIRVGKAALHEILSLWLPRLNPGGEAWLVVAKKLGADSLLPWIQQMLDEQAEGEFTATRVVTVKGFRILRITRA